MGALRLSSPFRLKKKSKKSMGALTDNRKRHSDLSPLTSPPLKKRKLPSPPSILHRTAPIARLPPAEPLRRPVHGPQRVIRVFGLGSTRLRSELMGNFVSSFLARRRSGSGSRSRTESECDEQDRGLGLEDYRQLVIEVEDEVRSPEVELPPPKDEVTPSEVEVEVEVVEEENVRVEKKKKLPLYRELYESSLKRSASKLNELEFEVKLNEAKVLGFRSADRVWRTFRSADQLLRKKAEKDFHQPFAALTDEDEVEIHHAMKGSKLREVLVTHETSNIGITRQILQCLSSGAWLNDEVINLYLELLKERERREPKRFLKCHFFNTFFYKRLISGGQGYDFKAVRRWTTQKKIGYGLLECDKIFVPVHKQVHWCLAIINVKDKKFQYLDSLGGMDRMVLRVLARYFMDEMKDKSGKQIDVTSWAQETVDDLPMQQNGYDCGMFMLKYTDFYSRGLNLTFGQEHMQYFRKRTAKEILRLRAD